MKNILTFLLVFLSFFSFCQNKTHYLEGTLDKYKIYMSLELFDSPKNKPNAVYFYQIALKDIPLEGTKKDNVYTLAFKTGDTLREKFVVKKIGTNFEGTWSNSKGETHPVKLSAINFSDYTTNASIKLEDKEDKLNIIKYKFIGFKKQKITVYNNKEIEWYYETHCKSPFFRLGNNFSDQHKKTVNPILEKIQLQNTIKQLSCSSNEDYNKGKNISYDTEITFLNKDLLGFKTASDWYCGGAHPDGGTFGYLINLNSGKNYKIDEIIAFDKSVTADNGNFEKFTKYRKKFFAPKLFELINNKEHFKKPKKNEDECDMTDLESWWSISWTYTEKGIAFTPSFPHAMKACEETYLVPFEKLKKHKNQKFKLNFN